MKRIKAINGYTIYEATERDEKKYNVIKGCFYIYFSSDIRDYGLQFSDCEYEASNLKEAMELCDNNFAIAKEIAEEKNTAVSYEEIEKIETMLDNGLSKEEIEEKEEEENKMTVQKINEILVTERQCGLYNALKELEKEIKEGKQHFYLFNNKIEVAVWYDCFIDHEYNRETGKDELYYNIEGKTTAGKYFNIKSTDAIAKRIVIK